MSEIKELLDKFATGEISAEEEKKLFLLLEEKRDELAFSLHHEYLHLLGKNQDLISKEKSEQILNALHSRIDEQSGADQETEVIPFPRSEPGISPLHISARFLRYFVAAASVLLFTIAGWWYIRNADDAHQEMLASSQTENPEMLKENKGSSVMPVALPDGSSVWLYPASRITYPSKFDGKQRVVHLSGKAFFEVGKNPGQPFLVVTTEMTTSVLGTSFTVDAFENGQNFSVAVKTGKVRVSKHLPDAENADGQILLTANQIAIFDRKQNVFKEGIVHADPAQIKPVRVPQNYRFEDIAVLEIFKRLSEDYGVSIHLDEQVLAGCSLTTTLSDKPFFEKLKIICEGIGPGTRFSEQDGAVTITSLGCNE